MNSVLVRWNGLQSDQAEEEILPCCGSRAWARGMAARRPIADECSLFAASDAIWKGLPETDWMEAFKSHPRIGDSPSPAFGAPRSTAWSREEQRMVDTATEDVKTALTVGNRAYEQRFKHIFIVCATGKSPLEILGILRQRLGNDEATEIGESAEQQRQIAQLRLRKWLGS
ncbi:MAG TPA: 2-oxo-4-hydroxy-4-carboxy-5-ureidoimidazoline decarboxylase [Candidatus Acidoferrum sp.]|nr:2-oxo-4-hydroxy-4-carboxy-5-ureidoimidazoline decarboxylase [Candidatus Acidoferrum sp.]